MNKDIQQNAIRARIAKLNLSNLKSKISKNRIELRPILATLFAYALSIAIALVIGDRVSGAVFGIILLPVLVCAYSYSPIAVAAFTFIVSAPTISLISRHIFKRSISENLPATLASTIFFAVTGVILALVRSTYRRLNQEMELRRLAEQKQAEMQALLVEANRSAALAEMAGAMCHELNNPLTGILGSAEILTLSAEPEDTKPAVNTIINCAQRMREVVKHWQKYSSNSQNLHLRRVAIKEALNSTLSILQSQLRTAAIEVKIEVTSNPEISADTMLVGSIFGNLLANSRDAFKEIHDGRHKRIHIKVHEDDHQVVVKYSDNAGGMPESVRARIFEPFFTTKEEGKGTGLGMAIVAKIMHQHGGNITVDTVEGQGTNFTLTFPSLNQPLETCA